MSTKIIQIPFAQGIDTAADKSAYSVTGKLSKAKNLHISPAHRDVLSRRPGVVLKGHPTGTYMARSAITSLDGDAVVTTGEGTARLKAGASAALSTQPNARVLSAETPMRELDQIVYGQCYIEDAATGHSCAAVITRNQANTTYSITARMSLAGVPQESWPVISGGTPSSLTSTLFGWYNSTPGPNGRFALVRCDGTNVRYHFADVLTPSTWLTVTTLFSAAKILDVAPDSSSGHVLILFVDAAGLTKLSVVNKTTLAVVSTSTIQSVQLNPAWGVVMPNVNGSTLAHVVLGSATADANAIRPYSVVPGSAPTVGTTLANPMYSAIAAQFATGGTPADGTSRVLISARVALVAATGGTEGLLLSLSAGLVLTPVTSANPFTPAAPYSMLSVIPCGRLWHDSSFEGTRFFGTVGGSAGCWQVKSDGIPYPVANVSSLRGFSALANQGNQGVYINGSTAKALFPILDQGGYQIVSGVNSESHCDLVTIGPGEQRITEHAGFALLTGGQPRLWDGARFSPAGMPQAPDIATNVIAAGGALAVGTYQYAFVWEYVDNAGRTQQSPATSKTITISVINSSVQIRADNASSVLDERSRQWTARYNLIVYRTAVGGSALHRGPLSAVGGYFPGTNTLTDVAADSVYAVGELLSLTEQVASEIESSSVVIGFADRFIGVRDSKPDELWYTKSIAPEQSLEYNQALTFQLPAPIVALATQDGNVYAFGETAVYSFFPTFADGTGAGGETDAQTISAGLGCSQPFSVVATPDGVFFFATRGVMLCPRGGGSPVFAGVPADRETQLTATQSVTGSAYNSATSEVFWVISDTEASGTHTVLVLNLDVHQWFTWVFHENLGYTMSGGVVSVGGVPVFSDRNIDRAFMTLGTSETDGSLGSTSQSPVTIQLETQNFGFSNFGEQQRVRSVEIECVGDADSIIMGESVDSGASYALGQTFATDQGPVVYQVVQQKAANHRFQIITSNSSGDFLRFMGLSIETVNLPKTNRVAATLKKG